MQIANKSQARKVVLVQLAMVIVLSALAGFVSLDHLPSALAGGLIATVANAVFSFWVFADYRAQHPNTLLGRLYGAEVMKLILVGLMFAGAVQLIDPLSGGALFGVFLCVHLMPGILSLFG